MTCYNEFFAAQNDQYSDRNNLISSALSRTETIWQFMRTELALEEPLSITIKDIKILDYLLVLLPRPRYGPFHELFRSRYFDANLGARTWPETWDLSK
jgi:hypothetical protein